MKLSRYLTQESSACIVDVTSCFRSRELHAFRQLAATVLVMSTLPWKCGSQEDYAGGRSHLEHQSEPHIDQCLVKPTLGRTSELEPPDLVAPSTGYNVE